MNRRSTPKIFFSSYRPKKSKGESKKQNKQLVLVIIIIIGGYFFTRLPIFQIKEVDTSKVSSKEISLQLNDLIGESILSSAVANKIYEIKNKNIELIDLHCDKGIPDTLRCRSQVREPVFGWGTDGVSYLLDRDGVVFSKNKLEKIPIIVDRAKVKVTVGDRVMSEEMVEIYSDLKKELSNAKYVVDNYYLVTSPLHPGAVISSRQDNKPFTPTKIEVDFSASYPLMTQVKLLNQVIESKAGLIKKRVDLRTPGYVYYK